MDNINDYLAIVAVLLAFYVVMMLYLKYGYRASQFTPVDSGIPDVERPPQLVPILPQRNVYETEDTRMQYPLLPPVSPMVRGTIRKDVIPANQDLYTSQSYDTSNGILDTPPTQNTNELLYSGGDTQMISVPLQYNYPYNEQLRSSNILVTPYNKIKFGNC
jgi:hypothetical protein